MQIFKLLDKYFEETILILLMVGISCVMFLQIIMRYIFSMPLTWPEELCRYMWIWTVFFSLSYSIRVQNMLRVDVLTEYLSKNSRVYLGLLVQVLSLIVYAIFSYYSLIVFRSLVISGRVSPALRIPMYLVYSVVCVGFFLSVVRTVQIIYMTLKDIKTGGDSFTELNEHHEIGVG